MRQWGRAPLPSQPWVGRVRSAAEFLLPFLILAGAWELLVRVGLVSSPAFPAPSAILFKLWTMVTGREVLWRHLAGSLYRLIVGYTLSAVIGILLGTLLAMQRTLRDMFAPILSLLISVPTIAWVPVFLIVFGLGDRTVIMAIFLGGFFAITYNTIRGIEMVDGNLIRAARIMGASGPRLFATVLLPGALVSILTGLRLGIGYAWRALVGGEMLAAMINWGIGKMIYQARFWNDVAVMFVGLMVIGVTGLALDRGLFQWLERATVEKWGMLKGR